MGSRRERVKCHFTQCARMLAARREVACAPSARAAGSLLQYGITPIDSAKTDVTMRFYVENQL